MPLEDDEEEDRGGETLAEGPGQRAHRRVGTMVRDKYRIDAFIATGSMANVYAATHRNGSRVALKILHKDLARDASMAQRFRREGYFANAIGHPGVVRAIDDDVTEDGCAFIVMELLEGENLEQRRQRSGGTIPLPEVLQIADAMLDVLSAAHDHEVLHRDLKPENVFITRKNEVKLLDFGVARFNDGRSSSDMTGIGMVLGTPAFMPPEQALGRREEVDARSDIWSVGATLFTVIAGESVHAGGDAKTKLIATARTPARPIRDVVPEVPRAVASVIDRALAFDKAMRWADANAMREALRWARMSLEEPVASQLERPDDVHPPPVPTRRNPDDEPTLAGRSLASTQDREPSFDDSTAKRLPLAPGIRRYPSADDVVTSAAPLTQRDAPPSMAMSEGPTFSLRNDPVFSLRRTPAPEPVPATERMPHHHGPPAVSPALHHTEVSTAERPLPRLVPETAGAPDPAALFRAALADTGFSPDDGSDARTLPRFDPRAAETNAPRPAAGAPPEIGSAPPPLSGAIAPGAQPATSPSLRTAPGIGAPSFPEPTASAPRGMPSAPPAAAASSSIPPKFASTAPLAQASSLPPAGTPLTVNGRPSLTPESPGPLLATIVPKRQASGGALRVLVPILVGVLAGVATYAIVVRQRAANASRPAATATVVAPSASVPATTSAAPEPTASAPAAWPPTASASTSAAPAASSAPPPKKPRPKARPKAPSAPATTADAPAPEAPAPGPAPVESLPKNDPE